MLATMGWQDGLPPGEHDAVKAPQVALESRVLAKRNWVRLF